MISVKAGQRLLDSGQSMKVAQGLGISLVGHHPANFPAHNVSKLEMDSAVAARHSSLIGCICESVPEERKVMCRNTARLYPRGSGFDERRSLKSIGSGEQP